ncbi:hypothetical protein E2C01_074765 [Portunus trituberculatus]|uniref:Uncharacterized protein n=1 Tax=Portunus trituberculatus TaxID=210409 RepID=A0A5B7II30_PORTR|nr:hypothetical protein [Portunus trituberculatus]
MRCSVAGEERRLPTPFTGTTFTSRHAWSQWGCPDWRQGILRGGRGGERSGWWGVELLPDAKRKGRKNIYIAPRFRHLPDAPFLAAAPLYRDEARVLG